MEMIYNDASGIRHLLEFKAGQDMHQNVFTVILDDRFCCELVKEEGVWMEPFHGATLKSGEFGKLIDKFFVFSPDAGQYNGVEYPNITL